MVRHKAVQQLTPVSITAPHDNVIQQELWPHFRFKRSSETILLLWLSLILENVHLVANFEIIENGLTQW